MHFHCFDTMNYMVSAENQWTQRTSGFRLELELGGLQDLLLLAVIIIIIIIIIIIYLP